MFVRGYVSCSRVPPCRSFVVPKCSLYQTPEASKRYLYLSRTVAVIGRTLQHRPGIPGRKSCLDRDGRSNRRIHEHRDHQQWPSLYQLFVVARFTRIEQAAGQADSQTINVRSQDDRLLTRQETDSLPVGVVHRDRIRIVGVSRFADKADAFAGESRSPMEMPARNARRNLTDVDGSADLVRITTTRIAHVFCLLYENETDFPSQPRLPFRRARTARGVIALDLEANRDASYETNGGVILWRAEGFRPVITSSAPCLVSPVVPLGQVAGRDGGHSALPAQSDERGSASRWTPPCSR